jgi:hypothetical protein
LRNITSLRQTLTRDKFTPSLEKDPKQANFLVTKKRH